MDEIEKRMIMREFSAYYSKAHISVPSIEQREFGIGGFAKKIESRHMGFLSDGMLKNYLVQESPLYISHSVAYYKFPVATPMEAKEWIGGDLVFDLDVHAGLFLTIEELEKVKADAIALSEDFLMGDFGISKNEMETVFSGGRGFHIHARKKEFLDLGGDERRELADYVGGAGIDYHKFFEREDQYVLRGPKKSDWGYRGRFCRAVEKALSENPSAIHRGLKKEEEAKKLRSCMEEGNWSRTPIKDIVERLGKVAEGMKISTIEVDAGVTIDTKRLIRVPETIHGGCGLVAKKVSDVASFNPYHDATAFGKEPLRIAALQEIGAQEFLNTTMENMKKGEKKEVPKSYGMYLLLKGAATLAAPS